jgi:hypothetical protein
MVNTFCQLDSEFLHHNRLRLMHNHWARLSRYEAGGQAGLLQKEIAKKRNHMPIRQLMAQAGQAVQRLKPIFMMSPFSIAMFLPPQSLTFDLVIFDEASQVRPVDAFGAILRGRQIVVVGDSRQLPPTTFFESMTGETETGDWEFERSEDSISQSPNPPISANESILDLFIAQSAPERMLRWHYRSRHESLIAVSNQKFYEQQLLIFPSPDAAREEVGLVYHHLPETTYDRGGSRTNQQEAEAAARAVMQHAHARPHLTLGVVAFSSSQRQAIEMQLEWLRRQDATAESFFQAHPMEPFFVKNLENVQGDERDVILISIGYGRSADGHLTMNFGPLNQAGGERRLNVLITRARRRCQIFTNLTAADIDLGRTDAVGVAALKTYLHYAQTGELSDLAPTSSANRSPLADLVAAALRQRGYGVDRPFHEVVDLAVRDGQQPHRYHLGIQLDGGRPPSARDRERIQPQVLRGLGWRFYRLWGSRWWQDEAAELERLLAVIKETGPSPTSPASPHFALVRYADLPLGEPRSIPAYTSASLTINPKARRTPWLLNNQTNIYYALPQANSYEFDAGTHRFVKVEAHNRLYRLQTTLFYDPTRNLFTCHSHFQLWLGRQKHDLVYDEISGRFYEGNYNSITRRWGTVKRIFEPLSGNWQEVSDAPRLLKQNHQIAAVVAPEVAADVRLEAEWVAQIVTIEGPIHVEELERRLAQAMGLTRRSATTREIVRLAGLVTDDGRFFQRGKFFYPANMDHIPVRNRAQLPNISRTMELIAPEEIEAAIIIVVTDAVAIPTAQLPEHVSRLLGFRTVGPNAWQQIFDVVQAMVENGRLQKQGNELALQPSPRRPALNSAERAGFLVVAAISTAN